MPKSQNELIIYLEDQLMYWFVLDEQSYKLHKKISIPSEIYHGGDILDESHLHYLLKKSLDELKKVPKSVGVVFNSDKMVIRTLKMPKLSTEEKEQLIKNELPQLFIQDLTEYSWTKAQLRDAEEEQLLLLTITPTKLIEKFYTLFEKLGFKKIHLYPLSNLLLYFLNQQEGGAVYEHNLSSFGYHYVNGEQVYTKLSDSEGLSRLFKEHGMDFDSVVALLNHAADEVTSEIDSENFEIEFFEALYGDRHTLQQLAESFPKVDRHFKAGTLCDEELNYFTDPIVDEEGREQVHYDELNTILNEHGEAIPGYSNKSQSQVKHKLIKIAAAVSACLLIGSYFIGQNLEKKIDQYSMSQSHIEDRNLNEEGAPNAAISINDEYQNQYPELINQIFLTKPEEATITSIYIENGAAEVNGQVSTEDALDSWIAEIEKITGQKSTKDSSAVIDGVTYFKFTIGKAEDNYV